MNSLLIIGAMVGTLLLGPANPGPVDTALYYGANASIFADWAQTRHIANNPDKFWETNPHLGRHPSLSRVDNHFLLSWVGMQVISRGLDKNLSRGYLAGVMIYQIGFVKNNIRIGIHYDF